MGCLFGARWLVLMFAVVNTQGQKKKPSLNVRARCLGNVMRVNAGPLGDNFLEVAVGYNNSVIPITQSLASQCGISRKLDSQGDAEIFVSLLNCFTSNVEDEEFTTHLNLRLFGNHMVKDELYQVDDTCYYPTWAAREVICDSNFMEVSVRRAIHDDSLPIPFSPPESLGPNKIRRQAKGMPSNTRFQIKTVVFYSPDERPMTVAQVLQRGYGLANTPTRLVLRSPLNAPETYIQDVAGIPMSVLRTSIVLEKKWLVTQIEATVACPTQTGGVSFTANTISWSLPRHIDPLISSDKFKLLEVHMGVNGQRLDATQMAARKYSMTVDDIHIVTEIPVGAAGGSFKSHVKDQQYFTSYTIAPMLELLWVEDETHEETKYKVLFSITTPPTPAAPQVIDHTVPEEQLFKLTLGPLASDVALVDITFPSGVLSVEECNIRGFNVQHGSQNGSKAFTLEVPFNDPVVQKMKEMETVVYSLQLTFGLLVLPESSSFAHTAFLTATLVEMVHPVLSGSCDLLNFYVTVEYGTPGLNFQTILGRRPLTQAMAQEYGLVDNGTHFSFAVPFSAPDAVFEAIEASVIRTRLGVALWNPLTNGNIQDLTLGCSFPSSLTECFSNGTMAVLAVKLEAVPNLNPRQLTLKDPSCGPVSSGDSFAQFVFAVNSCGTTRKFVSNTLLYENEISLPDSIQGTDESEYELKVSCYYDASTAHQVSFIATQGSNEPYAEPAKGQLQVVMRLASDETYTMFHRPEDYPIPKFLQQPIYFEVELMSANPQVSLELENCWATLNEDRTSQPRWHLIINGCPNPVDPHKVVFHPVRPDSRVLYPAHLKRFEAQMFAFAMDQDNLSAQLFVHCDVVICDANMGRTCSRQCSNQGNVIKGKRRAVPDVHLEPLTNVTLGPISLIKNR